METGFDYTAPEYEDIYRKSEASAFQHPLWLTYFYNLLVPSRKARNLTVTGRDPESGRLRFVLPLIGRRKFGLRLVETTDLGVSDYTCPVIDRDWPLPRDLAARVATTLPSHDVLRIRPIREEAVKDWNAVINMPASKVDFSAHATVLPSSYPDWRANAFDKSFTRYLDRKKRRFLKSGNVELQLLDDPSALRQAIGRVKALRTGRFEGDPIQTDAVERFYTEIAIHGASAGLARTYLLALDGEAVGYVFGLTVNGRFYYLLIGCDYERFGRHSPGLVMYDMIIERWIGDHGNSFDFTIGDEPFKGDFGATPTAMYEIAVGRTAVGRLALGMFRLRRRMRRTAAGEERQ